MNCHVVIWESDKSSRYTGRTLGVTKKLSDPICDIRYPHEMIFVEPTHVFLIKWLTFARIVLHLSLEAFLGWAKSQLALLHSLSLQVKSAQTFSDMSLGKYPRGWRTHSWGATFPILFLFGGNIHLYPTLKLLLLLMARGIVFICIKCSRVMLASVTLFGSGIGVEIGTRWTIREGIPFILPWSADLGVIPGTDGVGSNRWPWHDHNSGHGRLMQVDLGEKRLQDY